MVSVCISSCRNLSVLCPAGGSVDALWVWVLADNGGLGEIQQKTGPFHWCHFPQNAFSVLRGYLFLFFPPSSKLCVTLEDKGLGLGVRIRVLVALQVLCLQREGKGGGGAGICSL